MLCLFLYKIASHLHRHKVKLIVIKQELFQTDEILNLSWQVGHVVSGESKAKKPLQLAHCRIQELQAVALQSQNFQVVQLTNTVWNLKERLTIQFLEALNSVFLCVYLLFVNVVSVKVYACV